MFPGNSMWVSHSSEDEEVRSSAFAMEYGVPQDDNPNGFSMKHASAWGVTLKVKYPSSGSRKQRPIVTNSLHKGSYSTQCTVDRRNMLYMFITSDVHLSLLSDETVPFLLAHGNQINSAWFQQDGVRPRTNNAGLLLLHDVFGRKILLHRYSTL
jgi:hypothetical protein